MRWAARLFRSAVADLRPGRRRPRLLIETLEPREVPTISGTVFVDTDGDGVFGDTELGVPGVTVTATGAAAPVVTEDDGTYVIETEATAARLEFTNLPDGLLTGLVTATSGPQVRFLNASTDPTDVNLAVNPVLLATSLFNFDEASEGGNSEFTTLVSVPYGSDGTTTPDELALTSAIGSTWGLAYQSSSNSLFAAAFLKRHADLGPSGTGAIYKVTPVPDPDAEEPPVASLLIDLNARPDIDTGTDPRPADNVFDVDGSVYNLIGKRGLGGIALSADGRTLYAINLFDKEIIEIPLTAAGAVDSAGTIRHVPTPTANPTGSGITAANFAGVNMRPFAVTVNNGVVFVGVTYTGESNNRSQDLRAFVYAYDPASHTFRSYDRATNTFGSGAAPVLTVDLTYARPAVDPNPLTEDPAAVPAGWRAWTGTFPEPASDDGNFLNPQPWLTGLAFDGQNIVLGLRDRFGDQVGYFNRAPDSTDEGDPVFFGIALGDILRATPSGAGWAASGETEFYTGDSSGDTLPEVSQGAVAQVPGFGTVAFTGNDPDPDETADFSGGIYTLSNTTGAAVNRAQIYQSFGLDTFGNANGLGGLVAFAASAGIQAGDRVFEDTNGNGLQDPTELGIANVTVALFRNGTAAGTTTTDASGAFVFNDLLPGTAYEIRLDRTQAALANRPLATANQGTDDRLDSDATAGAANTAVIPFTTGIAGANVHALDAGFGALAAPGELTLGGTVWRDADNDGVKDTGETGIANVRIELLDGTGTPTGDTVQTGAGGDYSFPNIAAGGYRVRLAASNFQAGGVLVRSGSSGVTDVNVDNNEDDDDNGTVAGTLGEADGVVATGTIQLTVGGEPTGGNTNTTVDFGVTPAATGTTTTLGNQVFLDSNDNGLLDTGETGVPNVLMELLSQTGVPTGATATTNASGVYTFTNLAPGSYQVRIAASNFTGTGPLVGFASSATTVSDPENNVNGDDNGILSGTLGQPGGVITSGTVVLTLNGEPTDDGDGDVSTNLSLDFGVVSAATGTLALGSTVWDDLNNNGLLDGTETGINGVTVELLNSSGIVVRTSTTAGGGVYAFTGLAAGDYTARLASSNFNTGGALAGYTSSTGTNGSLTGNFEGASTPEPDTDTDNDDNGQVSGNLGTTGSIQSGAITLTAGGEPGASDTNNTLDFGVFRRLSIGNVVFNDANDNGLQGTGEAGLPGVTVRLLDPTGATQVATTTTSPSGQYLFTNLIPGDYIVELADTNFIGSGPLFGFVSSGGTFEGAGTPDPDTVATDLDDNGTTTGTLGQTGGVIRTAPVTLSLGGEPTGETPNNDPTATDNNANLTVDFGVRQPAVAGTLTLGDRVFVDANNGGTLDGTETGIGGVVLQLLNGSGAVIRTATTDATGNYKFVNVPAGDYQVQLAASNFQAGGVLVGYTSSTSTSNDPDNNTNSNDDGAAVGTLGQPNGVIRSGFITLNAGQEPINDGDTDANTNLSLDFGVVAPVTKVTVGGVLFTDANNNGQKDAAETGIAGVSVELLNSSNVVAATVTTDTNGRYTFANLNAGDYRVRVAATNFSGTGPLVGFTSSTGTNGSATGPNEGANTPDPDTNTPNDDNGTVSGTLGGTGATAGVIQTAAVSLAAGQEPTNDGDTDSNTNLTVDLGVFKPLTLGDTVFRDLNNNGTKDANEPGIPGVLVRVLNASGVQITGGTVTTNAQGVYSIGFLAAGTYIVELTAANFNAGGALFGYQSSTGTDNAFEPAPAGATNNQDHGTTNGTLGSGGGIRSAPVTLTTTSDASIDFGVFQATVAGASLSGRVFRDFNNDGQFNGVDIAFPGVTVTLTSPALSGPQTLTTDSSGFFRFTNLPAGTYTLTETQPTTPANQTGKDVPGSAGGTASAANTISGIVLGANTQAQNYRFAEIPVVSTGGSVFEDADGDGVKDAGEIGVAGVTVTLTGTSVVTGAINPIEVQTDSAGNYIFPNLTPGTYTITETQPDGYFDGKEQNGTPAATVTNDKFAGINLTNTTAASTGFNFGEVKAASIAGVVYNDVNNSGTQDTGETGITGVTIKLTGTDNRGKTVNKTTTTAADGTYSFTDLRPGTYSVTETQPAGYRDGVETNGTAGGAVQQDRFAGIPLAAGEAATAYRFGELQAPDLQITRTSTNQTINPGQTVTITYTVKNVGSLPAAGSVATLVYGGLTFVSATPAAEYSDATKMWTIGDLAPGASKTLAITLRADNRRTYTTTAAVTTTSTPEISTTNNSVKLKVFAGTTPVTPPPGPGPGPVPPATPRWFLSSGTNARKR